MIRIYEYHSGQLTKFKQGRKGFEHKSKEQALDYLKTLNVKNPGYLGAKTQYVLTLKGERAFESSIIAILTTNGAQITVQEISS